MGIRRECAQSPRCSTLPTCRDHHYSPSDTSYRHFLGQMGTNRRKRKCNPLVQRQLFRSASALQKMSELRGSPPGITWTKHLVRHLQGKQLPHGITKHPVHLPRLKALAQALPPLRLNQNFLSKTHRLFREHDITPPFNRRSFQSTVNRTELHLLPPSEKPFSQEATSSSTDAIQPPLPDLQPYSQALHNVYAKPHNPGDA